MREQKIGHRAHPGKGEWRAFADGEASRLGRLRLQAHLVGCGACRQRLREVRETGAVASTLLRRAGPRLDLAESWARLEAMTARAPRRPGMSPWSAFLAGSMGAASLAASVLVLHPGPTRMLNRIHNEPTFASVLDQCCSDQGGDVATREGVLTLQLPGVTAPLRVHYTDVDGSGTLSSGDIVKKVRAEGLRR